MKIDLVKLPAHLLTALRLIVAVLACIYVGMALLDGLLALKSFADSAQAVAYRAVAAGAVLFGMR